MVVLPCLSVQVPDTLLAWRAGGSEAIGQRCFAPRASLDEENFYFLIIFI
jgi:hypothetical protein